VIAAATGLSEAVVVEILSSVVGGAAAVELMIEELCQAMGAYLKREPLYNGNSIG